MTIEITEYSPMPSWAKDLSLATWEQVEPLWTVADWSVSLELAAESLGDLLDDEFVQERQFQRRQKAILRAAGLQPPSIDSNISWEERSEIMAQTYWPRYTAFMDEFRTTGQENLLWFEVLQPLTGPHLRQGQVVISLAASSPHSRAQWVDTTLYEQVDVDDYKEYPGQALHPVTVKGYLLLGTTVPNNAYSEPLAFHIIDEEPDMDMVLDTSVIENEDPRDYHYWRDMQMD